MKVMNMKKVDVEVIWCRELVQFGVYVVFCEVRELAEVDLFWSETDRLKNSEVRHAAERENGEICRSSSQKRSRETAVSVYQSVLANVKNIYIKKKKVDLSLSVPEGNYLFSVQDSYQNQQSVHGPVEQPGFPVSGHP